MDPDTLLQQLAPLREPAPISWWPLAPGWWILGIVLIIAVSTMSVWWLARHRRRQYRRTAQAQLKRLVASGELTTARLNTLLKATALRAWPHADVAGLHGDAWLTFLATTDAKLNPTQLSPLAEIYCDPDQIVSTELLSAAEHWIQHHRANLVSESSEQMSAQNDKGATGNA